MDIISEAVAGFAAGKIGDSVIEKTNSAIDKVFKDPKLEDKIMSDIITKYERESFYNSFSKYIDDNNVISHLIDRFNSSLTDDTLCESSFCAEHLQKFKHYYKYNPGEESSIQDAFLLIYPNVYLSKVSISNHSDIGKLQKDMHTIANSNSAQIADLTRKVNTLMSVFGNPQNAASSLKLNENDGHDEISEKVKSFLLKISNVANDSMKSDEEIIDEYFKLLVDAAIELNNESASQRASVICKINCNIALRYCNLGKINEAFELLEKIDTEVANHNASYHFVKAAIIVNTGNVERYPEATKSINLSIEIDKNYKQAWLIKAFLIALNKESSLEDTIHLLDDNFKDVLDKNVDNSLIADYYTYRAFIFREFGEYQESINNHLKAKERGSDEAVSDYNIGLSYYTLATQNLPRNERVWCGNIDSEALLKAFSIFKSWVFNEKSGISTFLKTKYVQLYVSTCCLLGVKHNLSNISQYFTPEFDYESKRLIILGSDNPISDEYISQLEDDDKIAAILSNLTNSNDCTGIIDFVEAKDIDEIARFPEPTIYLVLQSCIIAKRIDLYDKLRPLMSTHFDSSLLECLEGLAQEEKGNIETAKTLLDKYAKTAKDYNLLHNIILFYERNKFELELKELISRILLLKSNNEIYIENAHFFYRHALYLFSKKVSKDITLLINTLSNDDNLPKINKLSLLADYYSLIGEQNKLLNALTEIYDMEPNYKNGFNKALSLLHLMRYSEALDLSLKLFETLEKGMEDEKFQIIELICELYLFINEDDKSFEWAKKAHELFIDIPAHQSHRNFFAISTRTNHFEALKDTFEYKNLHPVVLSEWIKEFKISEDNPIESLETALETFTGEKRDDRKSRESTFLNLYRKRVLSNSMLLKHFNNNLLQYFHFAHENKIYVCDGNLQNLMFEQELIQNDVFVDALTLIVLEKFKCLRILNKIKNVHICYS